MHLTLLLVVLGFRVTLAHPAENVAAASTTSTTTSKTSTCSAASSVVAAISSCGGTAYCSSRLTPITTTVTVNATTGTVTKKVTSTSTSAVVSTSKMTVTSVVSTSVTTTSTTAYITHTSTSTITRYIKAISPRFGWCANTQPVSTVTSRICYASGESPPPKNRRNIAATTTSTCSVTYPAASITSACACLSVHPSTVTTTTTVYPTTTSTSTAIVTSTSTTTLTSTVKQTKSSTKVSTITKTTATVTSTKIAYQTEYPLIPDFYLQAGGSGTGADGQYLSISSNKAYFVSDTSDATQFIITNNGSLQAFQSDYYGGDYASATANEVNYVQFGSSGSGESYLDCDLDQSTCGLTCTDSAKSSYAQDEFCVDTKTEFDTGFYVLWFGQCSPSYEYDNYQRVTLSAVPGPNGYGPY